MKWILNASSRPRCRKWLFGIGVSAVFYALFGFFVLPGILLPILQNAISGALYRKTIIRELRVNPFPLSFSIKGLEIAERDDSGKWIAVEEIYGDLQIASIFRMGPVFREIRIVSPYVNVIRKADGSYNFSDILEKSAQKSQKKSKPLKFSLNNIQVNGGRVDFFDGPKDVPHKVEEIQIAIPFISNFRYSADRYIQPSFSAMVNGDAVLMKGKTKPFQDSRETSFEIDIAGLSVPRYLEYVPFRREYEVPSALLDVHAVLSFQQRKKGRPVVRVDGFAELRDARVTGKDKSPMIFLPSVQVVVLPADMGDGEYRLASLVIRDPEIDIVLDRKKMLNIGVLFPENSKENPDKKNEKSSSVPVRETSPGSVFSIDSIRLSGGKVRFSDRSMQIPFHAVLGDIRIGVDGFDTAKGKSARAEISALTEAGETAGAKATFSVLPVVSEGTFSVGKLAMARYAPYCRDHVLFDVMRGTLDLESGYEFSQTPEESQFRLRGLTFSVEGLRLRQREEEEDFLEIPSFRVKDARIDPQRQELAVGEISTENGRVWIRRLDGGGINLSRLVPEREKKTADETSGEPQEKKPWSVMLGKVSVERYSTRFDDRTTAPPAEQVFDDMLLRMEGFTTEKNRNGTFSFATSYNRTGRFSLDGAVSADPLTVAGRLYAKNLPMGALHPYVTKERRVLVTGGEMSASGMLRVSAPEGAPLRTGYKGEADIKGFAAADRRHGEEFLSFQNLHFGGMDISYPPANVLLQEIALSGFYSRIILYENASLNLQNVLGKGAAKENTAAQETLAPESGQKAEAAGEAAVRIGTLILQDGKVDFSDRSIQPHYSASLIGFGGRVSGISSEENGRADVDLEGNLGHGSLLEIRGTINPLAKELFLDLNAGVRDMDLSPLTPYSGRYAGYGIEKGKLTLNLSYYVEKRKLEAQNRIFLDQFTFGESMDSQQATTLPVKLAVSLLKDRNGEIHVDLPVSGDLDNPKFSFWGVFWQAVRNLLMKAAVAPFALVGSLLGGAGEQLSYLEFEPGSAEISPAGEEKIKNLAEALYNRPALKLEISGHADPGVDSEALCRVIFLRKVAARKIRALAEAGQPSPPLDNVTYQSGEYEEYLKRAYKGERFPKPRNIFGMAKDLSVPEMEKRMMANIQVKEGDLRQLAVDRAARVRDTLISGGRVESGRVFLMEPRSIAPLKMDNVKDSRVDFVIQ